MAASTVERIRARERALGRKVTENDLEPLIWERYQADRNNSAEQLYSAMLDIELITRDMALLQEKYDVLLSPTLTTPPANSGN